MNDLELGHAPEEFTAATWNVYHGSTRDQLDPILAKIQDRGVSLLFLQELAQPWGARWLMSRGMRVHWFRQYAVAWPLDSTWRRITTGGLRLSDTAYGKRGGGQQWSEAAWAILCDRRGRSLTAMSYHLPAHVQVKNLEGPQRLTASLESVATMQALAQQAPTTACLFAGDDNVDELHGIGSGDGTWSTWFGGPLRWVRSPDDTFGHRKIDDMAQVGLHPADKGWTLEGTPAESPSHRVYGRRFRWPT